MTKQEGKGEDHPCTNQNTFERFPHNLTTRPFAKLLKKSVLICRRSSFTPLPFAHRNRMDSGKLSELNLVKAKLFAQFSDARCVQTLVI